MDPVAIADPPVGDLGGSANHSRPHEPQGVWKGWNDMQKMENILLLVMSSSIMFVSVISITYTYIYMYMYMYIYSVYMLHVCVIFWGNVVTLQFFTLPLAKSSIATLVMFSAQDVFLLYRILVVSVPICTDTSNMCAS